MDNCVHGKNADTATLLKALGVNETEMAQFRDATLGTREVLPHYVNYAPVTMLTNTDSSERSETGAVGVVHVAAHCGPPVAKHDCDEFAAG